MDTNLNITEIGAPDAETKILRLEGPLLISNVFSLQTAVRACHNPHLVLDMTKVPYIDSSAVGVLVGAYVSRDKEGHSLLLVGVNQRIRTILQVTQVERFFKFSDQVSGASANL